MLIPRDVFGLTGAASSKENRHQLEGIHFARGKDGPWACATNGKMLVRATWTEEDAGDYPDIGLSVEGKEGFAETVPTGTCIQARKAIPGKFCKPSLLNAVLDESASNGKIQMGVTDLDSTQKFSPEPLGTYPDIDEVINGWRKDSPVAKVNIDARVLLQALKTMIDVSGVGPKDKVECMVSVYSDGKPVFLETQGKSFQGKIEAGVCVLLTEKKRE